MRSAVLRYATLGLVFVFVVPLLVSIAIYVAQGKGAGWRTADRSSAGLLPPAWQKRGAVVRIFSARTVSWRGIVATHSWIVIKDAGAAAYQRFDYTAWGLPVWIDRFVPDGRWFGSEPEIVYAADDTDAARIIPRIRATIEHYRFSAYGDYKAWPGPNSNTFVAAVMSAVPDIQATLPPTAIGKDFPYDGRWFGTTPSGTGLRLNAGGYFGVTLGWIEGFEINILGAVAGFDLRRPALKLPALGRLGFGSNPTAPAGS